MNVCMVAGTIAVEIPIGNKLRQMAFSSDVFDAEGSVKDSGGLLCVMQKQPPKSGQRLTWWQ